MSIIKKLLKTKLRPSNSLTDKKPIEVQKWHDWQTTHMQYNRHERRTGSFVIYNQTNGLYCQSHVKKDGTIVFKDVEIEKASVYMFDSLDYVISCILVNEPNVKLDYKLIYKQNGELKTK